MALLPELVHFWNTYQTTSVCNTHNHHNALLPPQSAMQATVQWNIPTMGCVACIHKIQASLQQAFPDCTASAWLLPTGGGGGGGGRASMKLVANNETELEQRMEQARSVIHAAGFPNTSVESIQWI